MKKAHAITTVVFFFLVAGGTVFLLKKPAIAPSPTVEVASPTPEPIPVVPVKDIGYHSIVLGETKVGAELTSIVGAEHMPAVLSLNRVDIKHLKAKQEIVVPDSFDDPFAPSSFPRSLSGLAAVPKMMFVSQTIQEFALYENGTLIRFGAVSTGKKSTQTPSKLYYANWKGKSVISTVDDSWIMPWYFNLDNFEGVSMHQFDLPGYPASHACIRMSEDDAKFIFDWADQWILSKDEKILASGTPVLIFGEYDYDATAPWKALVENPHSMTISEQSLSKEIEPYLEAIQEKQQERNSAVAPKL